jgi:hypothetical protein
MEVIAEQPSADAVLKVLTRLQDQLNRVYDSIFKRIDYGPCAQLLRSFIAMLSVSKTIMTVAAWGHATAIDESVESPGDLQLKIMDVTHLVELSLGLVEIDGLGCVSLAHETVGNFVPKHSERRVCRIRKSACGVSTSSLCRGTTSPAAPGLVLARLDSSHNRVQWIVAVGTKTVLCQPVMLALPEKLGVSVVQDS